MKCVICKTGEVRTAAGHRAEVKVGPDRLLVMVEAEVCDECGEVYYSAEALRQLEKVREDFSQRAIAPPSIGMVYQVS
jgi:YgiT-type zinc finger domain-containing protein